MTAQLIPFGREVEPRDSVALDYAVAALRRNRTRPRWLGEVLAIGLERVRDRMAREGK